LTPPLPFSLGNILFHHLFRREENIHRESDDGPRRREMLMVMMITIFSDHDSRPLLFPGFYFVETFPPFLSEFDDQNRRKTVFSCL
jgi:hypothetical protein